MATLFPKSQHILWPKRKRARLVATPTSGLIVLGVASALLYALGITARYPLAPGLQHVRAGWATLMHHSLRAGLSHGAIYLLLIAAYMLAMRLALRLDARQTRGAVIVISGGWLLCSACLLGAYPGESLDIFDYLFRGRMLVEYGASPLAMAPVAFNVRPFYEYLTWRGQVDTYGPLWEYASAAVAWTVHYVAGRADSQIAYILGYRLLAVLLAGLSGVLVVSIVRRGAPRLAPAALLAWLWNPLVLTTTAIGAHNDIIMVLAMLVSFWLLQRRRWVLGLLALVLAAHVKLTALLILPVVGLWLLRRCGWLRSMRIGALTLMVTLPLSWLLYAPLGGWVTLRRMLQERARLLINSPADLIYRLLQERYGWAEPDAWRITTLGATLLFFTFAAGMLFWFWLADKGRRAEDHVSAHPSFVFGPAPELRQSGKDGILSSAQRGSKGAGMARSLLRYGLWPGTRWVQDAHSPDFDVALGPLSEHNGELLWRASAALTLIYLLIGSFWFQHWYLLWLLAPAALVPASRWMFTLLPIYCLGALWSDLTNSFLRIVPAHPFTATQVGAINVLAQVTPLLLTLIATQVWRTRWRIRLGRRLAQPLRIGAAPAPPQYKMDDQS